MVFAMIPRVAFCMIPRMVFAMIPRLASSELRLHGTENDRINELIFMKMAA